jgi:predicted MPP superfamily phosphohydrolase
MIRLLEFGCRGPLTVRQERVPLGLPRPCRLLYASDLHLGHRWTRVVHDQLRRVCETERPDLILLGGDLVDHAAALEGLATLVRALAAVAPVQAIPGNHDLRAGIAAVRGAVLASGGGWLPDRAVEKPMRIDGVIGPPAGPGPRVLCAHYPADFPAAVAAGYALVLAGHLHGGQCVVAIHRERLYPAWWVHRWHVLRAARGGCRMLVSRGVADTLPVRFNCPREVLLCEVV